MKLPKTNNPQEASAFKKGYRQAIDEKSLANMPSTIRIDTKLKQLFEAGWEQAQEDLALEEEADNAPQWNKRFIWITIMVLGGLITALSMINNFEKNRKAKEPIVQQPILHFNKHSLSILSEEERKDLELNRQEQTLIHYQDLNSSKNLLNANIKAKLLSEQPKQVIYKWETTLPKKIRNLKLALNISDFQGDIQVKWLQKNQVIQAYNLNISSGNYLKPIPLSSRWQGEWILLITNLQNKALIRQRFFYVHP